MPKLSLKNITKTDIQPLAIKAGGTAIVLQRQEQNETSDEVVDRSSIDESAASAARLRDLAFFKQVFSKEGKTETFVLIISTDSQETESGARSMETAQLAQDAAMEVLDSLDVDPSDRILNLDSDFSIPNVLSTSGDASIHDLKQFSKAFHAANDKKRLIIWVASHYDTISPFIEETTGTKFNEEISISNGGGAVITIAPNDKKATLHTKSKSLLMNAWDTQIPHTA